MTITTIQISKETIEKLKEIGKMGDTYEDVILRLIEYYKNKEGE